MSHELWLMFGLVLALGLGVLLVLRTMNKQVDEDRKDMGK